MIDVSVIIVNFKTSFLVKNCLISIGNKTKDVTFEVIIIDNSEDTDEFSRLKAATTGFEFPISVYRSDHNVGFGSANNLGAKYSHGNILLFLNSDTLLRNNAIYYMRKALLSNGNIGVVGANLYSPSLRPSVSYLYKEQTIKEVKRSFSYADVLCRHLLKKNDHFNYSNSPLEIDGYISGACLMIPKSLFFEVGGFDKRIFMYGEDALLCALVKRKKLQLINTPEASVIHLEGGSEEKRFSNKKIANWVFGNYIFALTLYGAKNAKKYMKALWKGERKACIRYVFLRKHDSYINHHNLVLEYKKMYRKLVSK
jgi:GT2 family glycosyltransferase